MKLCVLRVYVFFFSLLYIYRFSGPSDLSSGNLDLNTSGPAGWIPAPRWIGVGYTAVTGPATRLAVTAEARIASETAARSGWARPRVVIAGRQKPPRSTVTSAEPEALAVWRWPRPALNSHQTLNSTQGHFNFNSTQLNSHQIAQLGGVSRRCARYSPPHSQTRRSTVTARGFRLALNQTWYCISQSTTYSQYKSQYKSYPIRSFDSILASSMKLKW